MTVGRFLLTREKRREGGDWWVNVSGKGFDLKKVLNSKVLKVAFYWAVRKDREGGEHWATVYDKGFDLIKVLNNKGAQ